MQPSIERRRVSQRAINALGAGDVPSLARTDREESGDEVDGIAGMNGTNGTQVE